MRRTIVVPLILASPLAFAAPRLAAQNGSMRVTVPSPTAASLGKFGDIPVSLYTGTPDISIPLFTAKGRTLELPIVLRYHAGGIKVEEIGSWVGLGWTLEAGGVINRTVKGQVDETDVGYYNTGHVFYDSNNWPPPEPLLDNIKNGYVDGDPDLFFFSFAGRSGQIVIGPTSTSQTLKEYRAIPYQKWDIHPSFSNGIASWTIITEDGTEYTFGAAETSTDWSTMNPASELGSHQGESHTSAWHLTRIRAPGGDSITFHYSSYFAQHRQGYYREKFDQIKNACVPNDLSVTSEYAILVRRLDSIKTAAHTVKFIAGATLRLDALSPGGAQQEPRLDKIIVTTPDGTVLRSFQFEHDYFAGNRLRLKNVYEQDAGGVSLPPYTFTYDPQSLPARTTYGVDHWGYYNGKNWNTSPIPEVDLGNGTVYPGADRSPDPAYMRMASLTKIAYPTGGYTEFVYESNDYGGGTSWTHPLVDSTVSSSGGEGPVSKQFTVEGTTPVQATVTIQQDPDGCEGQEWPPCPIAYIVGVATFQGSGEYPITLSPATYTMEVSDEWNTEGFINMTVQYPGDSVFLQLPKITAGGLRVAEMRSADGVGNVTVRKYKYTLQSDPTMSSGSLHGGVPQYHYTFNEPTCGYVSRSSTSKLPLGGGAPVGYSEVTVWHGANAEYGKTRHTFVTSQDGLPAGNSWPYFAWTSVAWKRGLPLEVIDHNAAGQIQRRVTSSYRFRDEDSPGEPLTTRRFRGLSILSWPGLSQYDTEYFWSDFYVISAWAYLDAETTTVYDTTGTSSFSATRTYVRGNPTHTQLTEISETNSDGTQRITRMKYPADYASGSGNPEAAALMAMKDSTVHMHSPAIERWVTEKVGATETVVQASLTAFRLDTAGHYSPYQTFAFNNPSGVTNFAPSTVSSGSFAKDSRYLLQETANAYDSWGRIVQLTDPRGKVTNYQYGGPNTAFLTKVTRVHDAGGANLVTDLAYSSDGYLASIKDEGGSFRYFHYDLFGRLSRMRNHGGDTVVAYSYAYSRTNANGWVFQPGSPNAITTTTYLKWSPVVSVVSTEYLDGLGRPIQTVVQDGASYVVAATQYDAMGRPWRTWKPYTRTTAGYDAGFVTNATSFYNTYHSTSTAKPYVETAYTPDALSRVKQVTPEFIGTSPTAFTRFAYGVVPDSQYVEVTDESGKKRRTYTSIFGDTVKVVLGYGAAEATTTTFLHSVLGQRTRTTDPRGIQTNYTLDTRGLLTTRANPDAGNASHKYDQAGNLRYSQDANQAAAGQVAFTTYDFAGRPLVSGQAAATFSTLNGFTTQSFESTTGNWLVVRQYDAKPTNVFPWNAFWTQISPLTLTNVAGRLAAVASKSNGAWQVTLFSYDADGRVATRYTFTQANGGGSVLTALNTTATYTRDLRDALTQRSVTVGASAFHQWYEYDGRGLLARVYDSTVAVKPSVASVTYTYRPSGQLASRDFAGSEGTGLGGTLVPLRYQILEFLEKIGDPTGTTYPFSARYSYQPNGTVDTAEFHNIASPASQKRYRYVFGTGSYDALNRLKSADYSGWTGSAWSSTLAHDLTNITYDAAGNLTALRRYRETGTLIDNLTYTNAATSNRLNSVSDAAGATAEPWDAETGSFTYDANGNVTVAPAPYSISAVTYDWRNLPTSLTRSGTTTTYRYDDAGQRITKQVGTGNTEVYILDGATTLGVFTVNGAGTPTSWFFNIVAGDKVIGRQPNAGNRRFYHTDLLGSTRAVTDGVTGAVLESYDFEPWGLLMPGRTLGSGTKEGFTGKEQDPETGLDYFGVRYYMAAFGRWTSVDPLMDEFPGWTPYNYVFNSPLQLVDPIGAAVEVAIDDWYIEPDGTMEVVRTNDSFDRFFVRDDKSGTGYTVAGQLEKNAHGLVLFPDQGVGFERYGTVDAGGQSTDPAEAVGTGDHYLHPETAARLFGFTAYVNQAYGFVMSFGDMSSSNGSDPWQAGFDHHGGHGHQGNRSGLDIDFRYLNAQGRGFQGRLAIESSQFSQVNNQRVYDAAKRFGFTVNFQGSGGRLTGVPQDAGHNNHGHIGLRRPAH